MSKRDSFSGLKCIIKSLPSLSNREGSSFVHFSETGSETDEDFIPSSGNILRRAALRNQHPESKVWHYTFLISYR